MKRIEAMIQPHKLSKVVSALHSLKHFPGFTVFDSHGQGHGRGQGGSFAYDSDQSLLFHRRCVVVIFCEADLSAEIIETIIQAAHTGQAGDGLIGVTDVDALSRIGNGGSRT